ncbi:uncharacterized protein SOCEGT47_077790 [Sorangium cellulosum]|jgi:hypothetical protein|uniref:Uncharacterized protein n=2 Tax=Sorangium cellulosum TaxID=56 RepID=A0A4P2QCW3_SORCE|nr:uncharacterized protein SOCEGT47_077790 [Sorangium cellulosum]
MNPRMQEPPKPEGPTDDDFSQPPNPGDPGPEQPKPSAPVDPAEDPRIPHPGEIPRGI